MGRIEVEICPPGADIAAHWDALARRAPPNVFMSPVALNAAAETKFSNVRVLLAWDRSSAQEQLVGLWAFAVKKLAPLWPVILAAPPYDYAFVSGPVVDPAMMESVIAAFLDAVARNAALPNVIRLKYLDGESQACRAMTNAIAERHGQVLTLSERPRPYLAGSSGLKRSGSTRKKLRQDWNRLSSLGAVDVVNDRSPAAVRAAFEAFLALEAGSWKGARGTALLNSEKDAAFTRRLIGDLAEAGNASVALLRIDRKPIAAQVLLYSGTLAYTWKTAFDAAYGKHSPGMLLVDKVSDELVSSRVVEAIESCSPDGSFMAQVWSGQRRTVDLLMDVGDRKSLTFAVAALKERAYARLREWRNRLRAMHWPRPKKAPLPASR